MTETKKNIYETINAVMSDIGAVGKNSKNTQQGFMFRGIDAVMNALNPAMIKHKLFVVPEILEQTREERTTAKGNLLIYSVCRIRFTFYAEDGSSLSAVVIGEGMDSGDKATNKAMSIAFKYACFQVFCIPTEEMKRDDPDTESHETIPKAEPSIDERTKEAIVEEAARTGVSITSVCLNYRVKKLEELTMKQGAEAVAILSAKPNKPEKTARPVKREVNEGFE